MSGPKDYAIAFAIERLIEIRRRNEAAQRVRAAAVQTKLMHARQQAAIARAAPDTRRQTEIAADLARRAEQTRVAFDRITTQPFTAHASAAAPPGMPAVSDADWANDALNVDAANEADDAADDTAVAGWVDVLGDDAAVKTFAAAELADWKQQAGAIASAAPAERAARAAALVARAEAIHHQAGETQAKFDTRNELLRDVIASLHELGYFVSDPQFVDPADPASGVVLKAAIGSEVVTTTIDLGSMVRSVWDGQEHEHCRDAFFDYVDQMKARGITVSPERDDLRERPVLKQKSANELPRSNDVRQTGER